MSNRHLMRSLLATSVIAGMAISAPVYAQTAPQPAPEADEVAAQTDPNAPAPGEAAAGTAVDTSGNETIVVTGSILRRTTTETPSPVTVLSSESLEQRGINTVSEGLQRVSANNAGTINSGWNNGSNFATGANAVSLRGLTVQSTLTIFNGLRMAPYPLADDGHRNFVDSQTIPIGIVDRIEVLRDGASSTYGADAVAGVVNIITKKEIQGIHLDGSYGVSERGDADEWRIAGNVGYGDIDTQGYNVYIGGEYQKNDPLFARDRGYPFNTSDLSGICNPNDATDCLNNGITFGISKNGKVTTGSTIAPIFAPYDVPTSNGAGRSGVYSLAPGQSCGTYGLGGVTLNDYQQHANGGALTYAPEQCQQDFRNMYSTLLPEITRWGVSGRVTARIGDNAEVWAEGNYYQVNTHTALSPLAFAGQTTPPGAVVFSPVYLPVYVCADGVGDLLANNGCDDTNGVLNPNNPFAADGQFARLNARYDRPRDISSRSRALRGAMGVSGSFLDDFRYTADFTVSNVQLDIIQKNFLIPQRLMDVIADGSYNFINPSQNSEEIRDYIAPTNRTRSNSDLWQAQGTIAKDLFQLPGGPLQVAIGVAYRHESIDNPSANPANDAHPFDRYYSVNAVGAAGSRNVKSAFFEIGAPIIDKLEVNLSGRYDKYSSGQKNFSPKIGAKFTPIKEVMLRGTWSKGFRIPSFNESFGLPTTGYITQSVDCSEQAAFCAAHGGNNYATQPYSIGLTSTGNPSLDPEKSTSYTLGAVFEPVRNLSFTVDYWNIKVKNLIGGVDYSGIPDLYYANNGVVNIPGVTVRPQLPDPEHPGALPLLGFIEYSFQNADSQNVSGIDLGANFKRDLGPVTWISSAEASYLIKFEKKFDNGVVQRYDGTLSPCDVTSCSGAPKWRGSWQNTFDFGRASLTATAYYTSGYDLASIDYGGIKGDCEGSIGGSVVAFPSGTPVLCHAKDTWNVDLAGDFKVTDQITIYGNVLNVFDIKAPFEPSGGYSINKFNPSWAMANVLGRYFRIGARFDLNPRPAPPPVYVAPPAPPPPPPAPPATQTCADGSVILATDVCPAPPPPPPPPPAPAPERGR
jgi:iron complex outermembrane receptor protein